MSFQYASNKLHDHAETSAGPDPDHEGPGMDLLRTTLSQHVRDPKRVVDLLAAFPGERDQMLALLQQEVGNAFVSLVLEMGAMEARLDAPAPTVPATITPASEPKSESPLVQEDGPVFATGPNDKRDIDANDVHQGRLGDCWLISAIGAMAKSDPEAIRTLIVAAPADADGHPRYRVTLYLPPKGAYADDSSKKQKQEFVVTTKLPLNFAQAGDVVDGKPELWVELIEKAFAVAVGDYEKLDGAPYSGLSALTPNKTEKHNAVGISAVQLKQLVTDADSQGRPITLFMSVRKNDADKSLVFEKGHGTDGHVFWVDHVEGNMVEIWEGHGHRVLLSFEEILAALWDFDIGPMPSVPK